MIPVRLVPALIVACAGCAFAAPPLSFVAGQYVQVAEPTIPVVPTAGWLTVLPVDLRNSGRSDLLVGMGVFPPNARTKVPMRILRPDDHGGLRDVTREMLGTGDLPSMEHPREIVTGDFNRDGRPDVFVSAHGYDALPFDGETNTLLVSREDGTLANRSSTLPTTPDFSHSAAVADIDGDGILDIYVGNLPGPSPTGPYFLMGNSDGTFTKRTNNLPANITSGARRYTVSLLTDLNGDGFPDLVLGAEGVNQTFESVILYNDGHGSFAAAAPVSLPHTAFFSDETALDVVPLDVNNDGRTDLIVLSQRHSTFQGHLVQMLVQQADGTFRDESATRLLGKTTAEAGPFAIFARVADINGDGAPDFYLVFAGGSLDTPADLIWINDGSGHFTGVSSTTLGTGLSAVEAIDVDADGMLDFVEISTFNGVLQYRVFLNKTARSAPLNYADMWWGGQSQNGWGVSLAQHGSTIFGAFFVYDGAGAPSWFVLPGGTWSADFKTFSGPIYTPTGTPLNHYDASRLAVNAPVGNVSLTFRSANDAVLSYTLNGVTGTKALTRQSFGVPDFRSSPVVGDLWWGGQSQNGWGVNLAQQYRTLFGVWYTYGTDGKVQWFVMPGGAWSGKEFTGTLYSTTSSGWAGTYDATRLAVNPVGSLRILFTDSGSGAMTYTFTAGPFAGTTDTKPITRQPF